MIYLSILQKVCGFICRQHRVEPQRDSWAEISRSIDRTHLQP